MNKNTRTILIVVAIALVIAALFIPYESKKGEQDPQKLTAFACSDTSENQENDTKLTKISCSKYQELTQSDVESLILIARPTCSYCLKFIPILEEIVEEYGITVNYFDTDALSETEVSEFYNSAELFKSNEFGTPTLMITKNGEIIKYSVGYSEKEETVEWLKEAGIIKDSEQQ